MKRRQFVVAAAGAMLASGTASSQPKQLRVGMLGPRPFDDSFYAIYIVRRLEQLGFRRGANLTVEYRFPGRLSRTYAEAARELAALNCDVLIAVGTQPAVDALRETGVRAPIVFLAVNYDPVRARIVSSLRKPGGSATGVYLQHEMVAAKRIDILRELLPSAKRFAVFGDRDTKEQLEAVRQAAANTGLALSVIEFDTAPYDLPSSFESAKKSGSEGVVLLGSPALAARETELGNLLAKHQLPGIGSTGAAEAGALFSYNADNVKVAARTADIAVRILQGAKPADLPVEQADEFEFIVNLRAARALGLKIPFTLLARATRVIE